VTSTRRAFTSDRSAWYLAACQSFGDDTDVVLLIPNLLKKDLASPNPAEVGWSYSPSLYHPPPVQLSLLW
jgi:hypothetical protein